LCAAQGKYHVPYFTAKARIMEYVKATYPGMTSVFPSPAYFYTNFMQYYQPTCGVVAIGPHTPSPAFPLRLWLSATDWFHVDAASAASLS